MAEMSLQSLWEMLRGGGSATPSPMSLSALGAQQPGEDDPWSRYNRPFGEVRGTAPEDTPVAFQTRNGVRITEGDIQRGMDVGMGAATVGGPTKGIKAYHSSPHDFDRFDLSKIGTGEGAQVYGHGIYAAENPAVSGQGGQYWQQFTNRFGPSERSAAAYLEEAGFDRAKAAEILRKSLANPDTALKPDTLANIQRFRGEALKLLESDKPVGPRTYELNIKADPQQMLDWDKPLREHSSVGDLERAGLSSHIASTRPGEPSFIPATGRDAYQKLVKDIGYGNVRAPAGYGNNPAGGASVMLNEAGIPGIKYLDEGSRAPARDAERTIAAANKALEHFRNPRRNTALDEQFIMGPLGTPEGAIRLWEGELARALQPNRSITSNYVIFDPANIDIMKKYGLAGLAPLAGAGALQQQPRQEVY